MDRTITLLISVVVACSLGVPPASGAPDLAGGQGTIFFESAPIPYTLMGPAYCCDPDVGAISPDGSGARIVEPDGSGPKVSPDGTKLAFSAADANIHISDIDGSIRQTVVNTSGLLEFWPTWSPDGRSLAFIRHVLIDGRYHSAIYAVDIKSGKEWRVTHAPTPAEHTPSWSPDGKWIAFVRYDEMEPGAIPHLHIVRPDGSRIRRLTHGNMGAWRPMWSPDGKRIAFSADRGTKVADLTSREDDIYVIGVNGGEPTQVTQGAAYDKYPCWSPDGQRIAFSRGPAAPMFYNPQVMYGETASPTDLFSVKLDGSDLRQITNTPHISEDACEWASV